MKAIIFVLLFTCVIFAQDSKIILQEYSNGLWMGSDLPKPETVITCFDDDTADNIVLYVPDFLEDCSNAKNIWDFQKVAKNVAKFYKTVPRNVTGCLLENPETAELCKAYDCMHIDYKKVVAYFTFKAKDAAQHCKVIAKSWNVGNYTGAGNMTAVFLKDILKKVHKFESDKDILTEALDGVFEESGLPDPQHTMDCIDETTAEDIVAYVPTPVSACAKAKSILDFKNIAKDAAKWAKSIPAAVTECLQNDKELNELCDHYDCKHISITHVISYLTFHAKKVAGECGNLEKLWTAGSYKDFGKAATDMFKEIIKAFIMEQLDTVPLRFE